MIEFPSGPAAFGAEAVVKSDEIRFATGTLKVITSADSVTDRPAAYDPFGDGECLEQAVLVCLDQATNLGDVRRWSEAEGKLAKPDLIAHRLER